MFRLEEPNQGQTIDFLGDLMRQVRKGIIHCKLVEKESIQSGETLENGRPLISELQIKIDFGVIYRPRSLVST